MVAQGHALARELTASTGDYGLVHGDLHLSNILDGGPARGLVAIDPRPSCGDRTWDAIDIALLLDLAASAGKRLKGRGLISAARPATETPWSWSR